MAALRTILLTSAIWLTACAPPAPPVDDSFCRLARPIYMTKTDTVSDDTARQIVAHDKAGAKLCGWARP